VGIVIKTNIYVRQIFEEFFLEKENIPKEFVDRIKKVILYFFNENCIVYQIM